MFLQYKKQILKAIKDRKMSEANDRYELNQRGKWWLRHIGVFFCVQRAYQRFDERREQIYQEFWRKQATQRVKRKIRNHLLKQGLTFE